MLLVGAVLPALSACPDFLTGNPDARFACNLSSGEDCPISGSDGGMDAGASDAGARDSGAADSGGGGDAGVLDSGTGAWHVEMRTGATLNAIHGVANVAIWAVGTQTYEWTPTGAGDGGPGWNVHAIPGVTLNTVWVGDGFEVGQQNIAYAGGQNGRAYSFVGGVWRPSDGGQTAAPLVGLWGDGAGSLWFASAGQVFQWPRLDAGWTPFSAPTGLSAINSIWVSAGQMVWVAGTPASGSARTWSAQAPNLSSWTQQPDDTSGVGSLFVVWGDDSTPPNIVTAGVNATSLPQLYWNQTTRTTSATGPFHAATGWANTNSYWVGGEQGSIAQWNGNNNWDNQPTPTGDTITGMWTPDGVNAWAVTDGGLILRYP
jgi:hypothetical protein